MWDRQNGPIVRTAFSVQMPDGSQTGNAPINYGCVAGSRMAASVQPTAADTVTIAGKVFTIVASLGAAAANLQVIKGGTAALTYAALVNAINGNAATKGVTWVEATTPFAATVLADMVTATQLRLRWATARGGLPLAAVPTSTALLASITGGAAAWTDTNLNVNGKAPADCIQAYGVHVVQASEVTAGFLDIELEFQPTMEDVQILSSTGALIAYTDTVTLPAGQQSIHITTAANVVAGTVVTWWAAV